MKQRTKKIFFIAVVILVVLFGVGQFFASSTLITSREQNISNGQDQNQTPTQVVVYEPPVPATSTPSEAGSCWTNSIAAPYRTDAWRCTIGNSIQDPCFKIPGSNNLLCNMNPAAPDATSSFVLRLTKPLPAAGTIQGGTPLNWAWLIRLADGTLCSPFTGTLPPVMLNGQTRAMAALRVRLAGNS